MGNYFAKSIRKKQEALLEKQQILQNEMRERQLAATIATNRDFCLWMTASYISAATALVSGYRKTKNKFFIAPLYPLTFSILYQWDFAYGNKIQRIRVEAERIMCNEADMLQVPHGLPVFTFEDD